MEKRQYIVIDLKSFYASVECVERDLDPMTTNLVVADASRTNKTICLAVSPSMKALGVKNRCRLFEIPNNLEYIVAKPRMRLYIERSADIYAVYLKYVSKDDIHVYSIDEAFLDVTGYLNLYKCTARELAERIRADVVTATGIPATCGLGTNLYLAKVALDITAKHQKDFFGELDEESYRMTLWNHQPITDFWRVGPGTARRLAELGIHTMGQLATYPQDPLYRIFGVDAEILIDHAWGIEPVTIKDIKQYHSKAHSLSTSQILGCGHSYEGTLIVLKEICDAMVLELVEKGCVASSLSLAVGYKLNDDEKDSLGRYEEVELSGRAAEHGKRHHFGMFMQGATASFEMSTNSHAEIMSYVEPLYRSFAIEGRESFRVSLALNGVSKEADGVQLSLFSSGVNTSKERRRQEAISEIKQKFGKNALLKAIDLMPEATMIERNGQIGGHRSG